MSASREKKQRQGGTPSDKGVTAQQQAAAARRKTIQYTVTGVVIAILVAALLVWNSGFFQSRATAATIGGTNYTAGQVSYFYHNTTAYQMTMSYAQYGMSAYDTSSSPREQVQSTDAETGAVTTYHDYFLQSALDEMTTYTALYDAALANGYSRDDVKDDVAASVASFKESATSYGYSYKQFLVANYGKYVTPSIYEDMLTMTSLANLYYSDYYEGLDYGDSDYQAYYREHSDELDSIEYSYLYFTPDAVETTDADGNDLGLTEEQIAAAEEENLAAIKSMANEAAAAMRGGSSAEALAEEYDPTNWEDRSTSTGSSLNSVYSDWLTDGGRQPGNVTVIENGTSGVYVVAFHDRYLDPTLSVNVRHILVRAEMDEGASAPTDEQMAAAKAKAEDLLAQWKAGDATEESFAALADEFSEDGRDEDNNLLSPGGLYEEVLPGDFVTNFNNWLFYQGDRRPGDTEIIENNGTSYYGYHAAYFVGSNEGDFVWEHTVRSILAQEDLSDWLDGLEANYTPTQADGAKYVGD